MDIFHCTVERNVQIVIALLKAHAIRKVIVSPGATNITFVRSLQNDSFFELFSCVDERSAAYMACGLAAESGECVAISCTGATASRNYMSGMTEAFYRKLPVLAITSTQHSGRIGTYTPQVIDRSIQLRDTFVLSVDLPSVNTKDDETACIVHASQAMIALTRRGGGPVHINLATTYNPDFSVDPIPPVPVIRHIGYTDEFPTIRSGRIGIFVGAHKRWTREETEALDQFCDTYDAVVFCDQTSNYWGRYRMLYSLVCSQSAGDRSTLHPDLVIYIGSVSGDYPLASIAIHAEVWRVNPDGEIRSYLKKTSSVFEMEESFFFRKYSGKKNPRAGTYLAACKSQRAELVKKIPELPFSNIWIASQCAPQLPRDSVLHIGILNSLRSWNFFETTPGICGYSNTGGFGIDGTLSTVIGASLVDPKKLFFCFLGDLSFFYDMNSLGNRHVGSNLRILVVNNGKGTEFRNYVHPGAAFGEETDDFIAAAGHFKNKSPVLLRHYAEDLGFHYLSASSKEEFIEKAKVFFSQEMKKSVVFEVFTTSENESEALRRMKNIGHTLSGDVRNLTKQVIGKKMVGKLRTLLNK